MAITISGSGSFTGATNEYTFDQSVGVAGTLTYEDVTDVDAVGVITAAQGLNVGPKTGIACTITAAGAITANGRLQADVTSGNSSYAFVGKSNHATRGTFRATNDGGGAVFVGSDGSTDNVTLNANGDTTIRDLIARTVTSSDQVISNRSGTSVCFRAQDSGLL